MNRSSIVSRRTVLTGMFSIPSVAAAEPLIDLANGSGIFASTADKRQSGGFKNLYTEDQPTFSEQPDKEEFKRPSRILAKPIKLNLRNTNINEQLSLAISPTLQLSEIERQSLNHFLRDWRENIAISIDDTVLKDFFLICGEYCTANNETDVQISSGYRSRKTNDMLRKRSRNVALNSMHIQGKAIDFYLPDISSRQLGATASKICRGGVGVYSGFVHIDSGARRQWEA